MNKLRLLIVGVAAVAAMLVSASAASAKDRNHDQIPDKWEKKFHLSLKVDQANKDQDRDKVDNLNEFQEGTNPRDKDTDNDGIEDGEENAGTIAGFDGTTLTIDLAGGGQVSGTVDASTRIRCRT